MNLLLVPTSIGRSRPRLRLLRRQGGPAVLVGLVVAAAYAVVGVRIHGRLGTGMDLTIFDQGVRALSQGHWPTSAMKQVGMNLWGDHFHPAIVLLAPLYWIWEDPRLLLLAQAALVGLTCALVTRVAAEFLGTNGPAIVLGCSLAASPGVQHALTFDFHEVALGAPVLALALTGLLRRDLRLFTASSLTLLLVKEDMGLLVFGLAMVAFVVGARWVGVLLGAVATLYTVVVVKLVIPAFSPTGHWLYTGSVQGVHVSLHNLARSLDGGGGLPATLVVLLCVGAFVALRSPLVLALLPSLFMRAISGNPSYWGLGFHYNLLPAVVLAFATIDGLRRVNHRRVLLLVIAAVSMVSVWTGPAQNQARQPHDAARIAAAHRALAAVPSGASVASDVYLTSQLSPTHPVTQKLWPPLFTDDLGRPVDTEWIVLDERTGSYDGVNRWVPAARARFLRDGYQVERVEGDFVVLRRV